MIGDARAWAIRKGSQWLHIELLHRKPKILWSDAWNDRTLFRARKVALRMAVSLEGARVVRITRHKVTRNQIIEIVKRYVAPVYVDVALRLLSTGSMKHTISGLHMPPEMVHTHANLAVSHLRRAGFFNVAGRLQAAQRRT